VDRHLSDCDTCRLEENELRGLKSILTRTPLIEPPADFEKRLSSIVFASPKQRLARSSAESWPLISGVALITAALTLLVVNRMDAPQTAPERSGTEMAWAMQRDDATVAGSDPFMSSSTVIPVNYVGK
jgi:hypothetical protein